MEDNEKIELRSEKVRHIIGEIPPVLVRSGISIVFGLMLLLFLATYFIPYPETLRMAVTVKVASKEPHDICAEGFIPVAYANQLKEGMVVNVDMDGYVQEECGSIKGVVTEVDRHPVIRNNKTYLPVKIELRDNNCAAIQTGMNGTACFLFSDKTVWELWFFHR